MSRIASRSDRPAHRPILLQLLALALLALVSLAPDAAALKAVDLNPDLDRFELTPLGVPMEARGDTLQTETAAGADGIAGRMSVRASTPGTSPNWFVFALRNVTDKAIERWLVAERYALAGSGTIWPDLDARRIDNVTPSLGFVPERLPFDSADAFRITLEPGQSITFAVELAGDRLPRMQVWRPLDYEKRSRNRQLFHGILLGIVGLLATFLTAVFAANHKAIFPSAALFTWCVLAYLCVDFGFWHKLFNVRPEENAQYRAAAEAAMAATLLIFVYTFLRLGRWHGFFRMLLGLWMVAQIALVGLAFLDPRLAATFARLSTLPILGVCALVTLYFAARGQDRALSIVPTWILFGVWLFGGALILTGRMPSDVAVNGLIAGLVLLVVLIGFTVTQYAFRSAEPLYGLQPDDQNVRSLAIDGSGAAVFEWSARREEVKFGPLVEAALGRKPRERIEPVAKVIEGMHPADRERFQQLLGGLKDRGSGDVRFEFRLRHEDNSYRWFDLEATVIPATDRRMVRCIGLVRETTDAKRATERLMHDAVHDSLTGAPNRALYLDRLTVALQRTAAEVMVKPTAVYIDLDRFKSVNSSFGHLIGDSLLITLTRRLQRLLGPADTVARIGGDQFAMIFISPRDERELRLLGEDIRSALKGPINIGGQDIVLTASIGMASYEPGNSRTAYDLLGDAEIAMYRAKRSGPDQIERFSAPMRADKDDRVALESDLRIAIEKKQLIVLFQPIVYLRTEELAGFEALVRWEHPRHGLMNPAEFVPLAEESDLIVKLGSFVLQAAVTEAQRWHKELVRPAQPLFVSVNVSSRQLFRQDLVNEVRHIMSRSLLPKGTLRLEITESLVMENPEQATRVLGNLVSAGARLAIDDFGTGYSSLVYLNTFPFDTVKVDRALVHMSSKTGSSTAILRSIVALAHELGKTVVAEGVETEEDVGLLRSIGCEHAQGFYYGEPAGARETIQLLKTVRKTERRLKRGGLFRFRNRPVDDDHGPDVSATEAIVKPARKRPPAAKKSNGTNPPTAPGHVPHAVPNPGVAPGSAPVSAPVSALLAHARLRQSHAPAVPTPASPPLQATANGAAPSPLRAVQTSPAPPLPPAAATAQHGNGRTARNEVQEEASRSLARLQAEFARPTTRPTGPPQTPVTAPAAAPPLSLDVTAAPRPTIVSPPAPIRPPAGPPPNLDTLPPAIAASLARLAGLNTPKPAPAPATTDAAPPPKKAADGS